MARETVEPETPMTAVHQRFVVHRMNHRVLFGKPAAVEVQVDHHDFRESTVYLPAGAIFALDLWEGTEIGRTRHWLSYVLQAGRPGDLLTAIPQVQPGAIVLMRAKGAPRCRFLLGWLAALQKRTDPSTLPPEFFLSQHLWMQSLPPTKQSLNALSAALDYAPPGPSTSWPALSPSSL